jgi:hypothetical protein
MITDRDCVALPSIDVRTSTPPPKDKVAVVRPPDPNSNARGQVLFDAAAASIRPPLPLPGRHPTRVAAPPLHDFDDHLNLSYLGIKGLSFACGTRRFSTPVTTFAPSRRCNCGDVRSSDSTFDLFSSLTICGAPAVTAGGVRVYLVGYIFCIID